VDELVCQLPMSPPTIDALGQDYPAYRPTFQFLNQYIDDDHQAISRLPVKGGLISTNVQGYLRVPDALVLYELAYFAKGDVLELGSAWGLSTSITARAICNSGRRGRVASVEIEPAFQLATNHAIRAARLHSFYESLPGDAAVLVDRLIACKRKFGFVFVDHDHAYEPSKLICHQLPSLLKVGGFALFHDFNDERNHSEAKAYGVYRAVVELTGSPSFAFAGVIGCCALVRRMSL
jgi:cephalosporin hydroxylase